MAITYKEVEEIIARKRIEAEKVSRESIRAVESLIDEQLKMGKLNLLANNEKIVADGLRYKNG